MTWTAPAGSTSPARPGRLRRSSARLVAVPLALALTAACGSTALRNSAQAPTTGTDRFDGAPGEGRHMTPEGSTGGGGGVTSGSPGLDHSDGGPSRNASADRSTATGSPGTGGAIPGSGGAVTGGTATPAGPHSTAPISVGVVGTDNSAIAAAFGADGLRWDTSPRKIISYINQTGGIGGRQIVPVFFGGDSAADNNTNGQRACSAFTEDHHVDVVVNVGSLGEVLPACLKQHGIAMFDGGTWMADATAAREYPNWIAPSAMRLDRSVQALLQNAASRGVLQRGTKLGVLVENCPWGSRIMSGAIASMAKKYGATVTQGSTKCISNILADLVPVQSDIQRETLKFSAAGVQVVLVVSQAEAFMFAQFTQQASQQKYHPKYLITSNAYPYSNSRRDATVKISPDAIPNILGMGTMPLMDLGDGTKPVSSAQAANQARCTKADPQRQQAKTNGFALNTFYSMCDAFYAMKLSLEADGQRFNYARVAEGWTSLLHSNVASGVLASGHYAGTGPNRLDGAGYAQPFAYDTAHDRFRYVAGPSLVP
jgi:hypothetical protein